MRDVPITEHEAGVRLDRYLRKLLPKIPLAGIFKHVRNGTIRVDGRKVAGDMRLQAGMKVQMYLSDADLATARQAPPPPPLQVPPAQLLAPELTPRIVRKDEHFLAIAKPAGLAVHGGTGITHSVVDWLATQRVGVRTGTWKPAPAHRIDRGTSGLLLIGLVPEALRALTAAFRDGAVEKVYHAVVHGVPKATSGTIRAPLYVEPGADRREAKVVVDPRGQNATTDYEVARTGRHMALLRVMPHEGRQHQIRAHLAHLGHAIMGDRRYGSVADMGRGFLLHCSELAFPHPATGKRVELHEPLPPAFLQLFAPE